jgi:hypothetical protein
MQFNQIVEQEQVRGRTIYKAIKASGGTITADMRKCMSQLNMLADDSLAGEAMDQADAAMAVNLADELGACSERYANGVVWSFAVRAKDVLGTFAPIKVMLMGLGGLWATFVAHRTFDLTGSLTLQLAAVGIATVALVYHSLLCAGCVIGKEKAGVLREFAAVLFMLMPVFAVMAVLDDSQAPRLIEGGSTYRVLFVTFFFAQGIPAMVLGLILGGCSELGDEVPSYNFDEEFPDSPLHTDPQHSGIDLGYPLGSNEI